MSSMPQTLEEMKETEIENGMVVNGVDSPNLLSVDSTEPIKTSSEEEPKSDAPGPELSKEEEEKEVVEAKEEKKEEEKEEVKKSTGGEKKDTPKVAKRIGELTKKWRTAEREVEYERQKRLEVEAKLKEITSKIPAEDKPLKVDFDDEDDYIEALVAWNTKEAIRASQADVVKEVKDTDERRAVAETYVGLDNAMDNGREKYEDFEELVLNEDLIISPEVTHILLGTEIPEDILYYLAENPDESARISGLDPVRVGIEMGRIEVKLSNNLESKGKEKEKEEKSEPKTKPVKKQSTAPDPITPVVTTGVADKDPSKMTNKEYRAWREKGKK